MTPVMLLDLDQNAQGKPKHSEIWAVCVCSRGQSAGAGQSCFKSANDRQRTSGIVHLQRDWRQGLAATDRHDAKDDLRAFEMFLKAANVLVKQPQAMQLHYLIALPTIASDRSDAIVFPQPLDWLRELSPKTWQRPGACPKFDCASRPGTDQVQRCLSVVLT
jgi:hypothetical protein